MHKFSPGKADRLENIDRYRLLEPEQTLRRFGLKDGMNFVDIGAGTGFFSRSASAIVGMNGTVYAVDISYEMLNVFRRFGVPDNVNLVESDEFDIPLNSATADIAFLAFVIHESENINKSLLEASRIIRPDGRIIILDWKKQTEENGPPIEERLALNDLLMQIKEFNIIDSGDLNPSHYFCILQVK